MQIIISRNARIISTIIYFVGIILVGIPANSAAGSSHTTKPVSGDKNSINKCPNSHMSVSQELIDAAYLRDQARACSSRIDIARKKLSSSYNARILRHSKTSTVSVVFFAYYSVLVTKESARTKIYEKASQECLKITDSFPGECSLSILDIYDNNKKPLKKLIGKARFKIVNSVKNQ